MPRKTLVQQNVVSCDIYENQIIVSFIRMVTSEAENKWKMLNDLLSNLQNEPSEGSTTDYYSANTERISAATNSIENYIARLKDQIERLRNLTFMYQEILPASLRNDIFPVEPTAVFLNIPQYHMVFECIHKWLNYGEYDFDEHAKYLFSFVNTYTIFELYILAKWIGFLKEAGYKLTSSAINTPKNENIQDDILFYTDEINKALGLQIIVNAKYVFTNEAKEDEDITLYYQPVIYTETTDNTDDIRLYRNTSFSYYKSGDYSSGKHYEPDFILKYKKASAQIT